MPDGDIKSKDSGVDLARVCRRYAWDWIRGTRIQIGAVSLVGRFGVLEGPNPSLYRNNIN